MNVKDLDRDLKNPDLKKEVDGLYGEVDSRWTKSKDLAQNREETLGKSQVGILNIGLFSNIDISLPLVYLESLSGLGMAEY